MATRVVSRSLAAQRRADPRRDARSRKRAKPARSEAQPSVVNKLDGSLIAAAALLTALGIVMIYSATAPLAIGRAVPSQLLRHLAAVGGGLVCAVVGFRVPLAVWRRLALPLWALSVLLLALTLVAGVDVNGARRWLALPGSALRFQPGELAKWATLLAVAAALARRGASLAGTRTALALVAVPSGLLLAQPDFGSAAVLIALCAGLLFAVGTPLPRLAALGGAALAGAAAYVALKPYALARWVGFLDPWQRARDEGFQLVQSFIAFGRGGSFGVGLGDGRQKLFYLPEAHTDFMLSVVAEELGLLGVLVVLGLFAALVVAGTRVALRARDPFTLLVAFGMTTLLALPAVVNAGVVMGLLPTTGFPLPFVSYGSNALLVCGLALGQLLRIGVWEAPLREPRVGGASPRGLL
jgi:cell division protein FtsW